MQELMNPSEGAWRLDYTQVTHKRTPELDASLGNVASQVASGKVLQASLRPGLRVVLMFWVSMLMHCCVL